VRYRFPPPKPARQVVREEHTSAKKLSKLNRFRAAMLKRDTGFG